MSYPARPKFFAMKFLRLLAKTAAAQTLGADACWLLTIVVTTEDATHYKRGVTFFTDQLLPLLAFGKWERLDAARRRAVEAGWLHYQAPKSGSRQPGTYWVLVPEWAAEIPDSSSEEGEKAYPESGDARDNRSPEAYPESGDAQGTPSPEAYPKSGDGLGEALGEPPSLSLTLHKKPRARFEPPGLEEVAAYCLERGNAVDPQSFMDHYTANGWVQKGGQKIKDWRAAVRTWERNGVTAGKSFSQSSQYRELQPRSRPQMGVAS